MTTKEKIKVMQAHVDGKKIRRRTMNSLFGDVVLLPDQAMDWDWRSYVYTVVEEPEEKWAVQYAYVGGDHLSTHRFFADSQKADALKLHAEHKSSKLFHMTEVMTDENA